MTLEQLRTFDAVVKYGSIRAASLHLYKSAPTVSSAIKTLESNLELKLFSRDGYRLLLTSEGQEFYNKVQQILRSVIELNSFSKQKWKKTAGKFSIVLVEQAPIEPIIQIISLLNEEFPDTRLRLTIVEQENVLKKLHQQKADLAISSALNSSNEGMDAKHLCSVPILPVASVDSKIATYAEPIRQIEILDEVQIVVEETGNKLSNALTNTIAGAKSLSINNLTTRKSLIMAGVAWGELPEHLVRQELEEHRLVKLVIEDYNKRYFDFYVVRDSKAEPSIVSERIWNLLVSDNAPQKSAF